MKSIWIVGGTTEGRVLTEYASTLDIAIYVSVATEYGASLLPQRENVHIMAKRMDEDDMEAFLTCHDIQLVIDGTHPYAADVTRHVRQACTHRGVPYWRIVRDDDETEGDCIYVDTMDEAAELLCHTTGPIFLTTGSKNLDVFSQLPSYQERIYARILSTLPSLERALTLGYEASHIICMQGPFSADLNAAMFAHYHAAYVVTKESGTPGGFAEKIEAARRVGATVIVIRRQPEQGRSLTDSIKRLWHWYKE